jgi:hypothetical protein
VVVNTTRLGSQSNPEVIGLVGGGFVVAWEDGSRFSADTQNEAIRAQVFDADGGRVGAELLVNTITAGSQSTVSLAALKNGGFVAAWQDTSQFFVGDATPDEDIRFQVFDAVGSRQGVEQVLVTPSPNGSERNPQVTGLEDGGFAIAFSFATSNGGVRDTRVQSFNSAGTTIGPSRAVNIAGQAGNQDAASIASLAGGGFVVVYSDDSTGDHDQYFARIRCEKLSRLGP